MGVEGIHRLLFVKLMDVKNYNTQEGYAKNTMNIKGGTEYCIAQ